LFSLAEARARRQIGVDKIAIGVDFPDHEGTWGVGPGTATYLPATLGAAGVTRDEARSMLGGNAVDLWKFDVTKLGDIAARVGPRLREILAPPTRDWLCLRGCEQATRYSVLSVRGTVGVVAP
jgi:hypothetical protein